MFRIVGQHSGPIVEDALPRTVETTAVSLRRVVCAEDIVEYDRATCVPPENLHNGGLNSCYSKVLLTKAFVSGRVHSRFVSFVQESSKGRSLRSSPLYV